MIDIAHEWGADLAVFPGGDLAVSQEAKLVRERLLRRLLTNAMDYVWHPDYGGGLGAFVGKVVQASDIASVVRSQVFHEKTISRSPEPNVSVSSGSAAANTVTAEIRYFEANSESAQVLQLAIPMASP